MLCDGFNGLKVFMMKKKMMYERPCLLSVARTADQACYSGSSNTGTPHPYIACDGGGSASYTTPGPLCQKGGAAALLLKRDACANGPSDTNDVFALGCNTGTDPNVIHDPP